MDFEGKLEVQIKQLVDTAPQDGKTPQLVTAIAPVLLHFATQLQRENFYVLKQSPGARRPKKRDLRLCHRG